MPAIILFLILSLSITAVGCTADDTTDIPPQKENTMLNTQAYVSASVELIRKGRRYTLEEATRLKILEDMPDLLDSCRDRDKRRVDESLWKKLIASGACIHVHFGEPHVFQLTVQPQLTVTELLIPLDHRSWRGKILTKNGDTYFTPFIACDSNRIDISSVLK